MKERIWSREDLKEITHNLPLMSEPAVREFYDRAYRECRIINSHGKIRGFVREECEKRNIPAKLPPDPRISTEDLRRFGFTPEFAAGIECARDLFEKLREARNAISHFLIETDAGESGVYLADERSYGITQ